MPDAPQNEDTLLQGRYRIVRKLGQGGMGTVYEAVDVRLDKTVALKETHFTDEHMRRQFRREALLLAKLEHPALTNVSDHFTEGNRQFLVMDFIPGRDLGELLEGRGAPFTPAEALPWAGQLLDALEYLHAQAPPVVHRDIKPQNLKLTDGNRIILLDFGLAKGHRDGETTLVPARSVIGATLAYAPLEQALRVDQAMCDALAHQHPVEVERAVKSDTGPRSDIYSLGTTLFHLLTGRTPTPSVMRAMSVWAGRPDPMHALLAGQLPAPLVELLKRATALDRDERYASAREMRADLREILNAIAPTLRGQDVSPVNVPPLPPRPDGAAAEESPGPASKDAEPAEKPALKKRLRAWVWALTRRVYTMKAVTLFAGFLAAFAAIFGPLLLWYLQRPAPEPEKDVGYVGHVMNERGIPVVGATVSIRDERGDIQSQTTDSVGEFRYVLKSSIKSARFTVTAAGYQAFEKYSSPALTASQEFTLTSAPPPPTVTPEPSPSVTPLRRRAPTPTRPCSSEDILANRC